MLYVIKKKVNDRMWLVDRSIHRLIMDEDNEATTIRIWKQLIELKMVT